MTRNEQMAVYFKKGWTLERIGQKYGLTRERVRQLMKKQGLTRKDGGQAVQMEKARPAREAAAQRLKDKAKVNARKRIKRVYGCSYELWEELGGRERKGRLYKPGTPISSFRGTRNQAELRNVKWTLTLEDWWGIWQKSGKWSQRGTKKEQYVMARINKKGLFSKANVRIVKAKDSKDLSR